jgi:hypothetical protein
MTKKQWMVGIVLADFVALNAYVLVEYGFSYLAVMRAALSTLPGLLLTVDLVIALSLIAIWMWRDAERRGIAVLPYLAIGLLFGSVGPLLYLLRTGGNETAALEARRGAAG